MTNPSSYLAGDKYTSRLLKGGAEPIRNQQLEDPRKFTVIWVAGSYEAHGAQSSYNKAVRTVIDDGKVPLTLLFDKLKRTRCGIADKYDGNVPVIALFSRPRYLYQHTQRHKVCHRHR